MLKKIFGVVFVLTALVYLAACGATDWKKWVGELDTTVDSYIIAVLTTESEGDENFQKAQKSLEKLNLLFADVERIQQAIISSNEQEEFTLRVTLNYIKLYGLEEFFQRMQQQQMMNYGSNAGMLGTNTILP